MRPEQRREHSASGKEAKNEGGAGAGAAAAAETVRGLGGNLPWVHPHRDINFELWTQKFVGASGNLDAVLLDAFLPNETFASQVELYPNKLLNLQQRTLRMGSVTYVPYTVTNYVVSNWRLSLYLSLLFRPIPNPLLLSPLLSLFLLWLLLLLVLLLELLSLLLLSARPKHTQMSEICTPALSKANWSPFPSPSHLTPSQHCPQRGVLVVLESSVCALCEVVMNKWPAVTYPSCLCSDLGGPTR